MLLASDHRTAINHLLRLILTVLAALPIVIGNSIALGQVVSTNSPQAAEVDQGVPAPIAKPFDRWVGVSPDRTRIAMYRSMEGIAIVNVHTGLIENVLPLTFEQKKVANSVRFENIFDKLRVRTFLSVDNRHAWVLLSPQNERTTSTSMLPDLLPVPESNSGEQTSLSKWDLRTSEMVDVLSTGPRDIVDVAWMQTSSGSYFLIWEKEWRKIRDEIDIRTRFESDDYYVIYDVGNKKKTLERLSEKEQVESGEQAMYFYHGVLATADVRAPLTGGQFGGAYGVLRDIQTFRRVTSKTEPGYDVWFTRLLEGRSHPWTFSVNFGKSEEFDDSDYRNKQHGRMRSNQVILQPIDPQTKQLGTPIKLTTDYWWTNHYRKPDIPDNASSDENLKLQEDKNSEIEFEPILITQASDRGVWVIKNLNDNGLATKAKGYFHGFDGSKSKEVDFPGKVLGGWTDGIILNTGLWTTVDKRFYPFLDPAGLEGIQPKSGIVGTTREKSDGNNAETPATALSAPQPAEAREKSEGNDAEIQFFAKGRQHLLVKQGSDLLKVEEATGKILVRWPLSKVLDTASEKNEEHRLSAELVSGCFLEEDRDGVVVVSYNSSEWQSERTKLDEEIRAECQRLLQTSGYQEGGYRLDERNIDAWIEYAYRELFGSNHSLVYLSDDGDCNRIRDLSGSVQLAVCPLKHGLAVFQSLAEPRICKIFFWEEGESDSVDQLGSWRNIVTSKNPPESMRPHVLKRAAQSLLTSNSFATRAMQSVLGLPDPTDLLLRKLESASKNNSVASNSSSITVAIGDSYITKPRTLRLASFDVTGGVTDSKTIDLDAVNKFFEHIDNFEIQIERFQHYMGSPLSTYLTANLKLLGVVEMSNSVSATLVNPARLWEALYLDLWDISSQPRRLRHIPIGKHLRAQEIPHSFEIDPTGQYMILGLTSNAKKSLTRLIHLPTNKMMVERSGTSTATFTNSGRVVMGSQIAEASRLRKDGDGAFRPLIQ